MRQLFDRELSADGVEPDGYGVLSLIGARSGMRLTELSEELGMPLTTASDVVRRLEARRVVRRRPNPEDGRSSLFELTAQGDAEWKRGWKALARIDEALARTIDREDMRQALTDLNLAFERALTDD
jgi:DNA-binding MarR family transcriptional regulator